MEKEITTNELMEFLQENMVTKNDMNYAINNAVEKLQTEMTAGFRMVREELDEIKARLTKLEKRTLEDADAAAKDVLELRHRVDSLEKQVRLLQSARS